jgi:hypothetical protein
VLADGSLLITGGQNGATLQAGFYLSGTAVASIETYDPASAGSRIAGKLSSAHFYHSASLLEDGRRVLVLGGLADDRQSPERQGYAQLGYAIVGFYR